MAASAEIQGSHPEDVEHPQGIHDARRGDGGRREFCVRVVIDVEERPRLSWFRRATALRSADRPQGPTSARAANILVSGLRSAGMEDLELEPGSAAGRSTAATLE